MKELLSVFHHFTPKKVMVVGDLMLDVYTMGKVRRISPEAPVSVLNVEEEHRLPGGAGNVILNAVSLGLEVVALGRIGADQPGDFLIQKLAEEGVDIRGVFIDNEYKTPLKNRVIADNQQIVRIDYEDPFVLKKDLEAKVVALLPSLLENVHLIAISDYAKGFITEFLVSEIHKFARKRSIPIIIDPKGKDFKKYFGSYLIKPNLSEAIEASGMRADMPLDVIAAKIIEETNIEALLITRSKDGMSLFLKTGERKDFPVSIREVKDVTGAGDTAFAMMMVAISNGWTWEDGIQLANLAAGISLERLGCARVRWEDLVFRLMEIDIRNKIFGEDHLYILQEALKNKSVSILALKGCEGLTTSIFKSIQHLSKKEKILILYMLDQPEEDFLHLLASLKEVSFIILKTESLHHLCEQIHPSELCILKNKDLHFYKNPQDFFNLEFALTI